MNGGGPGSVRSPGLVCKTVRCRNPSLPTTPSTADVSSCSRELPPLPFDVVSLLFELPGDELELAALELLAPDVLEGFVDAILLPPFVFLFVLLALLLLLLLLLPPFP